MKVKICEIVVVIILLALVGFCFGAWDNDLPGDNSVWNDVPAMIRDNWDALEVELGENLNEAHPYYQAGAPVLKPDVATALDVDDNGRLWVDSDDQTIYVLSDYAGPTWTSTATLTGITTADATFTLQNTDEEDSDGGRQSRYIAKGEQSGGEVTTLGYIEFSHDGTGDDEKGQVTILLNDGDDGNNPSKQAIGYLSTGKIDVGASLSVLDEDTMTSNDDSVLATQQSIVTYTSYSAYTIQDSESNTMLISHAYEAVTDGFVVAYSEDGAAGHILSGYVGTTDDPAGAGQMVQTTHRADLNYDICISLFVSLGEYFEVTSGGADIVIRWKSRGALSEPIDRN